MHRVGALLLLLLAGLLAGGVAPSAAAADDWAARDIDWAVALSGGMWQRGEPLQLNLTISGKQADTTERKLAPGESVNVRVTFPGDYDPTAIHAREDGECGTPVAGDGVVTVDCVFTPVGPGDDGAQLIVLDAVTPADASGTDTVTYALVDPDIDHSSGQDSVQVTAEFPTQPGGGGGGGGGDRPEDAGPAPTVTQVPGGTLVETTGCPGAVRWSMLAEVHRSDGTTTVPPEKLADVIGTMKDYVRWIGTLTGCAAAVKVLVVEDAAPWPAQDDFAALRKRQESSDELRTFDVTMLLRPKRGGDDFVGSTDYTNVILPLAEIGGQPYPSTATHEWLHILEHWYTTAPWPNQDPTEDAVHEFWPGYANDFDGVFRYFGDLFAARVDGRFGIRAEDWRSRGLPTTEPRGDAGGPGTGGPTGGPIGPGGTDTGRGTGTDATSAGLRLSRVVLRGRLLRFRLGCATGTCRLTLRAAAKGGAKRYTKRIRATIAGGSTKTFTLRLPKRAACAKKRGRKLTLSLDGTNGAGRVALRAALKAPRCR